MSDHDSERYGVLQWPLKEIAAAIGTPKNLLLGLCHKDVLKGTDSGTCEPLIYAPRHARATGEPVTLIARERGPIWYSIRMVRDHYVRLVKQENGAMPRALRAVK